MQYMCISYVLYYAFELSCNVPFISILIFSHQYTKHTIKTDPFDTIKVRLQTSSSASNSIGSFQSLFKGMAAPLCTAAIVHAIIFASYGTCTRLWEDYFERNNETYIEVGESHRRTDSLEIQHSIEKGIETSFNNTISSTHIIDDKPSTTSTTTDDNKDPIQNTFKVFMCGAAAGTAQALVICPMEHIKCRLQTNTNNKYKGPIHCTTTILKQYGLFNGLYRGMGVTLWRETPAFGMYFATYDTIKERVESLLEEKDDDHPIPSHAHAWAASALAGGISGAFTWAIIYPFDVIKSQIQTGPLDKRISMWKVGYNIVKEHGWRYMFRGLGVTLCRAFPVNAIIFPVYEFVLIQLGDSEEDALEDAYNTSPNPSK